MFFAFDGLDGTGKSTQIKLFLEWLRGQGHQVVSCIDPGSTPLGERVRAILLGHELAICRTSEMLLFMAARAQLVEELIRPAIAAGKIVVSDRYLLANIVYQGYAGGLDIETIRQIGQVATTGLMPDLVFVLDMAPDLASERMNRELDRMERQDAVFLERLRTGFLAEAAREPQRIQIVDAAREIDVVQDEIRAAAARRLAM